MTTSDRPQYRFFLAHHNHSECNSKCVAVGYGKLKFWICARCLGVYSIMALAITLDMIFKFNLSDTMRAVVFFLIGTAPWAHWALEHFRRRSIGPVFLKTISGAFLGFGLGLLLAGHFRNPWNHGFTFSIMMLVIGSSAVVFLESFFRD